ncbi:MAG: threonylcarbamoyl-AMP synthase [Deltaproteobacteria bacterium]|nr:threonylcarbamoyl-AMP synthase [Deltaproteobacteria bacterium]MBW2253126.1 threonylcarbamoyl-AMP synthase [Deltaproteobacteria bacterium]
MDPVKRAVEVLRSGGLVAFPTETVYGLGADADNPGAVRRIFDAKGRPPGRSLTVHLGPEARLEAWGEWSEPARRLANAFWPGPLTVIVPRTARVSDVVTGGRDTVGLRVPSHPLAISMLEAFGGGVAAPSANRSGRVSPTSADDVRTELGDAVDLVLDGGACPVGLESTVLSLADDPPLVLRLGAVTRDALEEVLGGPVRLPDGGVTPRYRPRTPLRVLAWDQLAAAVALETGPVAVIAPQRPPGARVHWVTAPEDAATYARELYRMLRALDGEDYAVILVAEVPSGGLWEAVASRLRAAESPTGG